MKTQANHKQNLKAAGLLALFFFALTLVQPVPGAFAALSSDDQINRIDFVHMMVQNQPESPLLPDGVASLSKREIYEEVKKSLDMLGVNVLKDKSPLMPVTQQEFVRLAYAFSGGESGKNLYEQKMYLKQAGLLKTADVGLTTGLDGKLYQTHKGQSGKKEAELASPVFMSDRLETDYSSKAIFTFDDQSTLTMSEDATVNISKHIYDPDVDLRQTVLKATEGAVRFAVTKGKAKGSMFKVETPTATAGVRGTEFVVLLDENGKTTFVTLEGQIETKSNLPGNQDKSFLVSAGQYQEFLENGTVTPVRKAPPGLIKEVMRKTTKPKRMALAKGIGKNIAKQAAKNAAKQASKAIKDQFKSDTRAARDAFKAERKALRAAMKAEWEALKDASPEVKKAFRQSYREKMKGSRDTFKSSMDSARMAKMSAKNAAKDAAKGAAKTAAKGAAKNAAKVAAKDAAKSAAKDAAKGAAKDAAKGAAKSAAKDAAKDAAKQVVKETGNGKGKGKGLGGLL